MLISRLTLILPAIAILVWMCGGNVVHAQSVTAILVGTVSDAAGAAVPNATVSAIRLGTNLKRTVMSNEKGDFIIPNLDRDPISWLGSTTASSERSSKGLNFW